MKRTSNVKVFYKNDISETYSEDSYLLDQQFRSSLGYMNIFDTCSIQSFDQLVSREPVDEKQQITFWTESCGLESMKLRIIFHNDMLL